MKRILSIQSQVAYGHVGNSAAVYPMQAKGAEVIAVPTALLSNHPHYPTMRGQMLPAALIADLLQGIEERGLVDDDMIVLSGYLGTPETARVLAEFIARARSRCPGLRYVCDPVIGDDDLGTFVQDGLIEIFRRDLVPFADVITPNHYELEVLAGQKARDPAALGAAAQTLGGRDMVVTGCVLADSAPDHVETIACSAGQISRTGVRRLPIRPCGTGDLFTGLLTARLAADRPLAMAAAEATAEIHAVLTRTAATGSQEMQLTGFPFAPLS